MIVIFADKLKKSYRYNFKMQLIEGKEIGTQILALGCRVNLKKKTKTNS